MNKFPSLQSQTIPICHRNTRQTQEHHSNKTWSIPGHTPIAFSVFIYKQTKIHYSKSNTADQAINHLAYMTQHQNNFTLLCPIIVSPLKLLKYITENFKGVGSNCSLHFRWSH